MIKVGTKELHNQLIWLNEYSSTVSAQSTHRTLGGSQVVQFISLSGGRLITIGTKNNTGIFTKDQIDYLRALEQSCAVVELDYRSKKFNVMVQSGGLQVEPLVARANAQSTDPYTGSVTFIEV